MLGEKYSAKYTSFLADFKLYLTLFIKYLLFLHRLV
jgi:hypothetical protein